LRIRSTRSDDWERCLELDASYETEIAWQMEEIRRNKTWSVRFREVRLPRKQRIQPVVVPKARLLAWERCDGFWVAAEHRQIHGYIGVRLEPQNRQARIVDLVVAASFRRRGIGGLLLDKATSWIVRKNVDQLILECQLKAQPGIAFAQEHGFSMCGFQDSYWPDQEVALFFRKRLR
jgi:ribosomal protein S18 acetylase RimI-like enzyme